MQWSQNMFALADCNNFYASCEEVFNPKLAQKPLIILSNNDGCVIARSKSAKEIGIRMGDPAFLFKERHDRGEIQMLSSNFTLYADMSQRVMQTLESYAPSMEIYSIDEAFFELEKSNPDELSFDALQMRQKVKKWTGIPVSIGIGPTKTLAKMANEIAKKQHAFNGVRVLASPEDTRAVLEKTPLEDIWGIGSASAQKLASKRIYTAADLADSKDSVVRSLLGVTGLRTALELRGIACFPCSEVAEKRQSIVCSRSFRNGVGSLEDMEEAVSSFASRAAEKLRDQKSRAGFLSVFIATSPFIQPYEGRSCHIELPNPTSYTPELIRLAKEGLARLFRPNLSYKKAGVMLGDFCDEGAEQIDYLSPDADSPRKTALMKTLDRINARYDKKAVQFAAEGIEKSWQSVRAHASPKFTTSWNELLTIQDEPRGI
jgi:DNA polymerase V